MSIQLIHKKLIKKKLTISVAESCTGGLLAHNFTKLANSSKYFQMGLTTYSNQAKIKILKVNKNIIRKYGAVSHECCKAMVQNLSKISKSKINISITGIAGPGGGEFGTTTGRRRRCGWFDGVIGKYAVEVNGLDCLAITKLDVLDELDEIHVCVAYELDGTRIDYFPSSVEDFEKCTPIFKKLSGWKSSTENCRSLEDLPPAAMSYLRFLAELMEVPMILFYLSSS